MKIYRYDRFDPPQEALNVDRELGKALSGEFLWLQSHLRWLLFFVEEPGFKQSLRELDHALANFISDEVEPIITLLENAQADLDKESAS